MEGVEHPGNEGTCAALRAAYESNNAVGEERLSWNPAGNRPGKGNDGDVCTGEGLETGDTDAEVVKLLSAADMLKASAAVHGRNGDVDG